MPYTYICLDTYMRLSKSTYIKIFFFCFSILDLKLYMARLRKISFMERTVLNDVSVQLHYEHRIAFSF